PAESTTRARAATSRAAAARGRARVARSSRVSCRRLPKTQQSPQDALGRRAGVEPDDRRRIVLREVRDARLTLAPGLTPAIAHAPTVQNADTARQAAAEPPIGQALFLQEVGHPKEPEITVGGERGPVTGRLVAQARKVADGEDLAAGPRQR